MKGQTCDRRREEGGGGRDGSDGNISPSSDDEAQLADAVQQSRGVLEEGGHLGTLVHGSLDGQEAAVQLVNQTHVHHVAAGNRTVDIVLLEAASQNTLERPFPAASPFPA